jgi:CPA2 family monovalent cation:H+ antiporter-2
MLDAHEFLETLAVVLSVAALATIIFQRLRQPVVFGYLLAGLIVGPHLPIPLVANEEMVRVLAELGVILLMFSLGLEFNVRKLIAVGPTAGVIAVVQGSALIGLGFGAGRLFGWTPLESFYAGAIIAISSTTIIVKAFAEQNVRGRVAEIVFGILIIEDLIAIFLLVILTAVSSNVGVSARTLFVTAASLGTFLVVLGGIGILVVPRLMRAIVALDRPETTLVASIGICFSFALLALQFDYSVALGAFLAGSLIAESGEEKKIEHLVQPVRDLFAAIFFVSVGMLIDPELVLKHWVAVLVFSGIVIGGNVLVVSVATFFTGADPRTSVKVGMSLGQIGEFSFIIAGLGLTTGATREFLYPVAVAVSALTTLTTPWMIRFAEPTAKYVDRKLPRPMQTFVALYGSWIERIRAAPKEKSTRATMRRFVDLIVLDIIVLAGVVIGAALEFDRFSELLSTWTGLGSLGARGVVLAIAAVVAIPVVFGAMRTARMLARALAFRALPAPKRGKVDNSAAPRRALINALHIVIVVVAGVPLLAVTQPFLPPLGGITVLVGAIVLLSVAFWRSTRNLQGHAMAGAEIIAALFSKQLSQPRDALQDPERARMLEEVLPGLGQPEAVHVPEGGFVVGKSLAKLDVRGITGATILAITRDGAPILIPDGKETLRAGDIVALAGSREAIEAARDLMNKPGK